MRRFWFLVIIASCSDEPALFPADYSATYQEVRNCRHSLDHDLMTIRVLASPEAVMPYVQRLSPFPVDAIVLKEQYADSDTTCVGPIVTYTVIKRLASSPETLGWQWQKVGADLHPLDGGTASCVNCHKNCGEPPDGYEGTCTVP